MKSRMWLIGSVTFLAAFVLGVVGTWLMCRLAPRFGLVDQPSARKVHVVPTPLGGGVAIWAAVLSTVALAYLAAMLVQRKVAGSDDWFPDSVRVHLPGMFSRAADVAWVLGVATVVMLMGLVDDRRGLSYVLRLIIQVVLVLVLMNRGVKLTLLGPLSYAWISGVLTVAWIVGLTNAFNFLDNMDGLSAGVAWVSSALFCAVMALVGNFLVAGFLLALMGALGGFLCFNWPPAKIFMGDAGSNFVGFTIGAITVAGTFMRQGVPGVTEIALFAPLCVLAVPIYDSVTVILIRLREGRSPFKPDKNHFSHRLVALGMTPKQAVLTIYLVTLATGLGALLLYPLSDMVPGLTAGVVLLQILCLLRVVAILESAGRKKE